MTAMAALLLENGSEESVDETLNSFCASEDINTDQTLSNDDIRIPVEFLGTAVLTPHKPDAADPQTAPGMAEQMSVRLGLMQAVQLLPGLLP
ncbi:hypothetical protein ABBQ38_000812 [Trebouxia sp. C0009 RCD-2024]